MKFIFTEFYSPAYKAGGPITSISNILSQVDGNFRLYSRGHDLNEKTNLNVKLDQWTNSNQNWYVGFGLKSIKLFIQEIWKFRRELFYVNGIFDWKLNLIPILLGKKIILAPRGMLQSGAMKKGVLKKKIYILLLRRIIANKEIKWHATDEVESKDIISCFGKHEVIIIPNLIEIQANIKIKSNKKQGSLRLIYYSLISSKKNLFFLLEILEQISGDVQLSVFGPEKDLSYVQKCKTFVNSSNTLKNRVTFHNTILKSDFVIMACDFDYFVLPTFGENFGHAIVESLSIGLPVLISDQTPWKFNSSEGNYSLSLNNRDSWIKRIYELIEMDSLKHLNAKSEAIEFFHLQIAAENSSNVSKYKSLLDE